MSGSEHGIPITPKPQAAPWYCRMDGVLFVLALGVYLVAVLYDLGGFPANYLFDEAIQIIHARNLLKDNLHGPDGTFLPVYFPVAWDWSISVTVYLQALGQLFVNPSIAASRGICALFSLGAAVAVALALKRGFNAKFWWAGVLLLAATPAWLLHARTALVVAPMVTCYAMFFCCYLYYVCGRPNAIFAAMLFGALAYYCYSAAQLIIPLSLVLLTLSDYRYHWAQRGRFACAVVLLVLLLLPAVWFRITHPELLTLQLSHSSSILLEPISFGEKLIKLSQRYLASLSPDYWFFAEQDLVRHRIPGYGQLARWMIPFMLLGLLTLARSLGRSPTRALLIALAVTTLGGAVSSLTITRVLAFLVPVVILVGLGLNQAAVFLSRYFGEHVVAAMAFIGITASAAHLEHYARGEGLKQITEFGLGGMQWGTQELFEESIPQYLEEHPGEEVRVASNWANGGDVFPEFYGMMPKVKADSVEPFLQDKLPIPEHVTFVVIAEDVERMRKSGKFLEPQVIKTLSFPNGMPGFYFIKFEYSPQADGIFRAESLERTKPLRGEITIDGRKATVYYSLPDLGAVESAFDDNLLSVLRGYEANPYHVRLVFEQAYAIRGVEVVCGDQLFKATLKLADSEQASPSFETLLQSTREGDLSYARFVFPGRSAAVVDLDVLNIEPNPQPRIHVHLYEMNIDWAE